MSHHAGADWLAGVLAGWLASPAAAAPPPYLLHVISISIGIISTRR
jgi:hypothetical protein